MTKKLLWAILIASAIFRIWGLGAGDLTGSDEIFYGMRAISMLDYDNAPKQSTPLEWFDPINRANKIIPHPDNLSPEGGIPTWTKLSFHDHPPLVFLVQNLSMQVFGENKFGFRFPSAIAGILTVYLIYLIGRRLMSEKAGLLATTIGAITVNAVHNSRLGLQEPILILMLLAAIYYVLRAEENTKYLLAAGAFSGLAMLAKYNAIVLAPLFGFYLFAFKKDWLKEKNLWIGIAIAVAVFSPVIVYNLAMYQATGHFDFQLSYVLGQNPEIWQSAPGKEAAGTFTGRLLTIIPALAKANSWPFLILSAISLCWLLYRFFKKTERLSTFLLAMNFFMLVLIVGRIGPAPRFLAMLTPFFALACGAFLSQFQLSKKILLIPLGALLLWEAAYTINSDILPYPVGPKHFAWSRLRYENYRWGYNQLDNYLAKELAGKFPAFALNQKYKFLDELIDKSLAAAKSKGAQSYSALIVYDNNLQDAGKFWSLDRLQIYHGWPVVKTEGFFELQNFNLPPHTTYFIIPTDKILVKSAEKLTASGTQFEQTLIKNGVVPAEIKNGKGEVVLKVYKF